MLLFRLAQWHSEYKAKIEQPEGISFRPGRIAIDGIFQRPGSPAGHPLP